MTLQTSKSIQDQNTVISIDLFLIEQSILKKFKIKKKLLEEKFQVFLNTLVSTINILIQLPEQDSRKPERKVSVCDSDVEISILSYISKQRSE